MNTVFRLISHARHECGLDREYRLTFEPHDTKLDHAENRPIIEVWCSGKKIRIYTWQDLK